MIKKTGVAEGRRRATLRQCFAYMLPVLCIAVWWCASGTSVRAQENQEFILRAPAARVQEIAARHGLTIVRQLPGQEVFLVRRNVSMSTQSMMMLGNDTDGSDAVVAQIGGDPDVVHFEQNAVVVTPEVASGLNLSGSAVSILDALSNPNLVNYFNAQAWTGYVNQPATAAIRLSAAHGATGTGAGIVAIIDTGVDPRHPVLASSLVAGYDFVHDIAGEASEWTGIDGSAVSILDGSAVSILDHHRLVAVNGSAVAILDEATATALNPAVLPPAFGHGTMVAGLVHLVAPSAKIMPLKAFSAEGTSTVFDVVRAIYFAVEHGARVINMSFSSTSPSPEIAHAINFATSRGVICVASAGNLGQETLVYPGALRNVVGVGSTTSNPAPERSAFSNFGDALISIGAPGEAVVTTYPGGHYAGAWGTSFSTPLAAGGASLLLQIEQGLNQDKAEDRLGRAQQMEPGMGRGRLNLLESVLSLPDTAVPQITILTPSAGPVFGSALVAASASDNVSVAGVRFLLDGNPLGAEDTSPPYELMWPTLGTANGSHVITALARDAAGNEASSLISVTVANDLMPPTVALTSPSSGATVSGVVTVNASASDDLELAGVRFTLNGSPLGDEDTEAPYELAWPTTNLTNGAYTLSAVARDAAGKSATASVTIAVANDTAAPTVTVTSPAAGSHVDGTITLMATAADDIAIVGVQFRIDGVSVGAEDTTAPYQIEWRTTDAANGSHTVTAVARDAVGNHTSAASVSVTVDNDTTAPVVALTNPAAAATVTGTIIVTASAIDVVGVAGVQFTVDGANLGAEDTTAPYEAVWSTTSTANGAHTLTAIARDAAGNFATATPVAVTVFNDTTAPTVAVTSPASAATVAGTVTMTASAADDVGVAGVQFQLDGANVGAEDTTAPYEAIWSTTSAANGAHTLTAIARDAAGNFATSPSISVTVFNDTTAPTVAVTNPVSAAAIGGTVTVTAAATDDVGVAGVQFQLDGTNVGAEDATEPYELMWSTTSATNGAHTLTAVARDAAGNLATATPISVTVFNDTTAPSVAVTSPASAASVAGTVTVTASVTDDVGVAAVQFQLDGANVGAEDTMAPYEFVWSTPGAANGPHTLTAVARDAAGNVATSTPVSVTVFNDTTAPSVAVTSPESAATVAGTVTIAATATDDVGVAGVQFQVNGANVGAEDTTAPYEFVWSTTSAANGPHTLAAIARDAAGNLATAPSISVTVFNDTTAPTVGVTTPAAGATVTGTVTVAAAATDEVGVAGVQFQIDGANVGAEDTTAPFEFVWSTTSATNGAHTLAAIARDAAGNLATAAPVGVTVFNDTTAPTVAVTSPASAATVAGTITLTASATDDAGVAGVQFQLDGANVGAEDTTAPYEVVWSTASATNGAHTLTATARDAAGNFATATPVSVTVFNDTTAPSVAVTSPATAATVTGTITMTASATDDVSVAGVQFQLDGANVGAEDTAAPYEFVWSTASAANGAHTLTAIARDAAGNFATATPVSVTVFNDTTAPTVAVTSPASAATVAGTVTIAAAATDDVSVAGVQFQLDGANVGAEDTTAPYEFVWSTTGATNGSHTVTAIARDVAGNLATATPVSVTVFNDTTAPTVAVTSPASAATVAGTVTVAAAATDDAGIAGVLFQLDGVNVGAEDSTAPYEFVWSTAAAANGPHTLTAVARDAAGNLATATPISVTVLNDTAAPTVAVTSPASEATVAGTITLTASATDDAGVVGVQFQLDGVNVGAEDTTAPYEVAWPTTSAANGAHALTAIARDAAGNLATAIPVSVTVFNDTTAPTVAVTSPASEATVAGTVTLTASATDDAGVAGVQFQLDGVNVGAEDTTAPYEVAWPTTSAANGAHALTAIARDAAGNFTTATPVSVTVFNDTTAPTVAVTSPASAATVAGTVTLTASAADDVSVAGVQFQLDGVNLGAEDTTAPYEATWPTAGATNGPHTVTAIARDAAGNFSTATLVSVTVFNDTTAPTVAVTSPASAATVAGTVTLTASAVDDVSVEGVQFQLDGVNLGAEDTTAPYEAAWPTDGATNGAHTVTAIARDAAGNQTIASVEVIIAN